MKQTPLQYWQDPSHYKSIIEYCLKIKGELNPKVFRTAMHQTANGECINFKVTVVKAIIDTFQSRRILDISAGWGDRLIGAIACNVDRYVGADPNPDLFPGYNAIKEAFCDKKQESKFTVIQSGFMEAKLPNETFDLVLTSPPYFELEIYNEYDSNQSIRQHPTLKTWTRDFLCASIKKAWGYLANEGHMVISIQDYKKNNQWVGFTEAMILFIQAQLPGAEFLGNIGSGYVKQSSLLGFRPMWCFKKSNTLNEHMLKKQKQAFDALIAHYPFLL